MQKPMPVSEQWLALIDDDVVPLGQFQDPNAALARPRRVSRFRVASRGCCGIDRILG